MKIKLKDTNGITLKTKDKVCTEDIEILVDESIGSGSGGGESYENGDDMLWGISGYTVTINNSSTTYQGTVFYSLDNGVTWNDFYDLINKGI